MLATMVCRILGVAFVSIGLAVFVVGSEADRYHNVLHFGTGLIALYFGLAGSPSAARRFSLAFGGGYLAFGILGTLVGDPAMDRMWQVGPLHLTLGDHVFHIVLGTIILAGGIFTRPVPRQSGASGRPWARFTTFGE
jgi:uncharacterized protein DUF4383